MDRILKDYHYNLRANHQDKKFPGFSSKYSDNMSEKRILVILKNPGNAVAIGSGECCITNEDETSENQRRVIIGELNLPLNHILFWNFYPYYGPIKTTRSEKIKWASELQYLTRILDNLKIIVVSGNEAWEGMKFFSPPKSIPLIWTPLPSNQGLLGENREFFSQQWRYASQLAYI